MFFNWMSAENARILKWSFQNSRKLFLDVVFNVSHWLSLLFCFYVKISKVLLNSTFDRIHFELFQTYWENLWVFQWLSTEICGAGFVLTKQMLFKDEVSLGYANHIIHSGTSGGVGRKIEISKKIHENRSGNLAAISVYKCVTFPEKFSAWNLPSISTAQEKLRNL